MAIYRCLISFGLCLVFSVSFAAINPTVQQQQEAIQNYYNQLQQEDENNVQNAPQISPATTAVVPDGAISGPMPFRPKAQAPATPTPSAPQVLPSQTPTNTGPPQTAAPATINTLPPIPKPSDNPWIENKNQWHNTGPNPWAPKASGIPQTAPVILQPIQHPNGFPQGNVYNPSVPSGKLNSPQTPQPYPNIYAPTNVQKNLQPQYPNIYR